MRETKSKHVNSQLISMLAFGATEENIHTLVRPHVNHQTDSCRKGCPGADRMAKCSFQMRKPGSSRITW